VSMTLEPIQLREPDVSKKSGKTKVIIVIASIVISIIVGYSIVTTLSASLPSSISSTKIALCTTKVLELAQKGIIRDVAGYGGAIYECTHMHGLSSVYGKASM
jgi:hypothetical protein